MLRSTLLAASLATAAAPVVAATFDFAIPNGMVVDLSGLTTPSTVPGNSPVFTSVGIASITVDNVVQGEFYDPGPTFGAGRALFNNGSGEVVVLDENQSAAFGGATFTIDFAGPISSFGFRLADTSNGFATPTFTTFRGMTETASETINGIFNAQTEFGFTDPLGITRIVIETDDNNGDGVGITDLTVGSRVDDMTPIPLPAGLPLLAGGLALLGWMRKRA